MDDSKDKIFKLVQEYLKPRPLIVWGAGATIPFGMPSMEDLKNHLSIQADGNLEDILSNITEAKKRKEYECKIFRIVNQKDSDFRKSLLGDDAKINQVIKLMRYFYNAHPQLINIVTTNYDCILEYIFSYDELPYTDGFCGREFSKFDENLFKKNNHINLYKVHGSLRWSKGRYSYYNKTMDGIFPSKEKYQKASQEPYRTIINEADRVINVAQCFLVVGFGFNDEHVTPKLETAIKNGEKIVVIAKKATESAKSKLREASRYVLIEQDSDKNKTKFSFKESDQEEEKILQGKYWEIQQFNKILGVN